jgi:muramidase (phage lysozyme)
MAAKLKIEKGGMKSIPARFGLIWFSSFRGEDLNDFYQNMPNLHNRYISANY